MIDRIIKFALRQRILTLLLVVLVSIWGIIVYFQMPKDIYPDLNAPLVTIITEIFSIEDEDLFDAMINRSDELAHFVDFYKLKAAA